MARQDRHKTQHPILAEYTGLASVYDKKWSFYIEATTRETLARMPLRPTDRVLDVGCGTGALLQALAGKYPGTTLVGIDPVPEMLAVARKRLAPTVELHEGWAEELPFGNECFDVVVSCNVFHFIRQPVAALKEMGRVLRPGGEAVITDWCDDYLTCRVCDWYLRLVRPAHYKVYRQSECLQLLEETGYRPVRIERYKINWLWGLMTATAVRPVDAR